RNVTGVQTCALPICEIFGKHVAILRDISAFVVVNHEHKVYFTFNENLIDEYFEEIVIFCDFGSKQGFTNYADSYLACGQINMYRSEERRVGKECEFR